MRSFPFGQAAFSMLVVALLSGFWLAAHPSPAKTATLTYWTFAKTHYLAYQQAVPSFEAAYPGVKVDLQLVSGTAVTTRLQAAFWADLDVPDLVEVEISSAGSFFRGPLKDVGFLDLTERIHQTGLWDRMVQARFAPYTSRGHIFGLPHDVHPVQLAYRRDIFAKEGVDAGKIRTWDDFIRWWLGPARSAITWEVGRSSPRPSRTAICSACSAPTGARSSLSRQTSLAWPARWP
jgi:arabinosaccharide transport system substrate-binding protein